VATQVPGVENNAWKTKKVFAVVCVEGQPPATGIHLIPESPWNAGFLAFGALRYCTFA
jgi:hypothetical protein